MNWLNKIKGSFYTLFFIVLNVLYLIIELSFNARILDVSAAFSPTTDFGQLEIYGRTISASGATLLAWRLLAPTWSSGSLIRLIIKFFLIALIVFPVVFMGQKNLVDNLVNQSSNETRRTAEILSLLKFGVANGFVEIEELAVDELLLQTAEGKMFITLSGLLAYNSNNMRHILERELDKIAGYAIATQQSEDSHQLYKSYRYVSKQIMGHYGDYQKLVDTLESRQSASYREAITLYQNAMNSALLQWLDYQQQIKQSSDIENIPSDQVAAMQYLLMTAQQRVNNCSSGDCYSDGIQQLQLRLAQQLGFYSPVTDWCEQLENDGLNLDKSDESQKSTQGLDAPDKFKNLLITNKVTTQFLNSPDTSIPYASFLRLTDFSRLNLRCLKNSKDIHHKIISLRKLTLAVSAGLTRVHRTKLEFLKSIDLRSRVFSLLKQQGIATNAVWTFDQHEQMLEDITGQLKKQYLDEYETSVLQQFSANLKPRTELTEFSQLQQMQNYYSQAFSEFYRQPVKLNLTHQEFEDSHIAPIYFAKLNVLVNKLNADEKWYETDAPYEKSGKSSVRNLLVPAVAIAFSLIFGLLNLINLILNLLFLLIQEKFWLRWVGFTVLTVVVLMMPVRHNYKIYDQPAYVDLLSETEKNYGLWAKALDWVAKTEPLVYPIGNILRYNLLDGFSFD